MDKLNETPIPERLVFIAEFGDKERDIINDLCEKFGIEEE